MKTKDVKAGMKFEDFEGCSYVVTQVEKQEDGRVRVSFVWVAHHSTCLTGEREQHSRCNQRRGPDDDWLVWNHSSNKPDTLLNPEQFQEPAMTQTQTKPQTRYKHTVEITTTRTADALERSLAGDAYTAKVVKSEQIKEAKFKTGTKIKTSLGYSAEVIGFHNGMYWLRDLPEGPYRSVNDLALDDAEEVK